MKSTFILGLTLLTTTAFAGPAGWKTLIPTDVCKSMPGKGVEIQGDFRGDHKIETAVLLSNAKLKQTELVIKSKDRPGEATVLWKRDGILGNQYIRLISPGTQKTWCGKNKNCAKGEAYSVELKNDGIGSGQCETAEDLYYWDETSKKFVQVSTSD